LGQHVRDHGPGPLDGVPTPAKLLGNRVTEQDVKLQQNCGGAMSLLADFKKFLLRGNVVDLAVAIVIGTAFTAVVKALVSDLFTPIIALIFGKPDFAALAFTINHSRFSYGDFLNNLFAFMTVAAAIFFVVVAPMNALLSRRAQVDPDTKECPECTSTIPVKARRCPMCTSHLVAPETGAT
jgi:large conductance mechanosensitive channel